MKMCAAFAKNGHQVTLFVPKFRNLEKVDYLNEFDYYGVEKNFIIKKFFYPKIQFGNYLYSLFTILDILKNKPDLIYSRFLLGSFFVSVVGLPNIFENHNPPIYSSRIQQPMFNNLFRFRSFKLLVVITEALKRIYLENYKKYENLIYVAPDGADLLQSVEIDELTPNKRLQVGYLGHLYQGRGIELILEMAKNCTWADFHIVGGAEDDIERIRNISVKIKNVTIQGYIPPPKAELFRLKMDVLLAPYQEEVHIAGGNITTEKWMSPLKLFEYMASSKPIICSDISVLREVLKHQRNCLLCAPTDINAWISSLTELRNNTVLRNKLAENALYDLKTNFLWEIRAKRILIKAAISQ